MTQVWDKLAFSQGYVRKEQYRAQLETLQLYFDMVPFIVIRKQYLALAKHRHPDKSGTGFPEL